MTAVVHRPWGGPSEEGQGPGGAPGALRVAQLANFVGPTSGGLSVVVEAVGAEHARRGGERLSIVPGPAHRVVERPRQRLVTLAGPPLPGSGGSYHVLRDRRGTCAELAAFGPDVVEVHDQTTLTWAGRWARRAGSAAVLFSHERLDFVAAQVARVRPERFDGPGRWWSGQLAERFDAVVVASEFAAEPFRAAGASNVVRIPFGVDLETFAPRARTRRDTDARVLDLVFLGRLWPEKAPDVALDVVARLAASGLPVRLVMLGTGPMEAGLRERARRERLPVHFTGHLTDRAAVAALMAGADVALAPGPRETFGLAVLEAMACGTPVVVSARGASSELVAPGAGIAGVSAEAMAHGVRALLADPQAAVKARARAEQFSWRATCDALGRLRAELVADRQPAARRRPRSLSNRSSRSRTSVAAQTRLRPPPETSTSTPASTRRSTAR